MAEILKEWLSERLQRPIQWEADNFGESMKDGQTIADILRSYCIINEENYNLIHQSQFKDDIDSNWQYLNKWLFELDIHISNTDLSDIKSGKGSILLKIFYQLFLYLDKHERINYIRNEFKKSSKLFKKQESCFFTETEVTNDFSEIDYLAKPLLNENYLIEWQRKKEAEVKEIHEFIRYQHLKRYKEHENNKATIRNLSEKDNSLKSKDKLFFQKYPCTYTCYSYDELINLEEDANKTKYQVLDTNWAKQFLDKLQSKKCLKSDSEKYQKHICNDLTNSIWNSTIAEEEANIDAELAKNVMKLSQIEKQMCTEIMETKQQARNLVRNRTEAERQISDQREKQFAQYLNKIKDQINLEVGEIEFEKERQNNLHNQLYAEKIKRKKAHNFKKCYETVISIVDLATKFVYCKMLTGDDVPEYLLHQWKTLFINNQPIFEIMECPENLYTKKDEENDLEEEIIKNELGRQECMNHNEFLNYHKYQEMWSLEHLLPNFDSELNDNNCELLGNRILGHVVYTLLQIKYPFPPKRLPAELPPFCSRVILRNLPDRSITTFIQALLNYRKLFVVRLESAINYCLKRFKEEMVGCTDIEMSYDKFLSIAPERCKDLLKNIKLEDDENEVTNITMPLNIKQTQTPKTIPEEDIVLSPPAELGKYAYKALSSGESLTDHLISAILVEYLKDQCDISGFVIINYPNTYREAQILEETFTGRAPPDEENLINVDEMYLEENIQKFCKKEQDSQNYLRTSELVENPHTVTEESPFISYFTAYINLKATEDILKEYLIWVLTEENSELIDRFYATMGINYSFYYEFIDKDVLQQICKYIIGDFELPLKSNNDLFGENVLEVLDFPLSEDKRQSTKIIKPEQTITQKAQSSSSNFDKHLMVNKSLDSTEEIEFDLVFDRTENISENVSIIQETVESKLVPGENNWIYGNLPISEDIGTALTTIWETIEKAYKQDLKQLFFAKRLQLDCLIPYARFLKDKMNQIISLPSNKQELVLSFLQQYNKFEDDWRNSNRSKNEWHCRIKELQKRLYRICDERKIHAERQRQALITENWAIDELTCMVNTFISCMQTELNRSVLTHQLLHDFYFTILKGSPTIDRLVCKELSKISRENIETKKLSAEEKIFRQIKAVYIEMQLKNIVIDFSNNPFNIMIENNVKLALKTIKDLSEYYRLLINKENTEISKITAPAKTKRDQRTFSSGSISKEDLFKINALKCLEEWSTGVNGEMCRFNVRIQAIQHKCYRDIKLFNDHITKTFLYIQNDINKYYTNELKSIDRLCKYLQMAIEHGRKIPETLILTDDTFIIDPNLLQFLKLESKSGSETYKLVNDFEFKVGQIARLRSQFQIVAPTGIIIQQALTYILQDFILFSKESCDGSAFPKIWKNFDPEKVPKLITRIFGESLYVDWRDFLIYCCNLRYPSVEELLNLRKQLRCMDLKSTELVHRDTFLNQNLWFEGDFDVDDRFSQFRLILIKHFLFELFAVSPEMMNYSAFLLGFSKHCNPIVGFANALSVTVGNKVCYDLNECETVVKNLISLKEYKDACKICANACAKEYIDVILNKTMNKCLGTTVTEIEFTSLQDKKKKSKGSNKIKKDGTQSERVPKLNTSKNNIKPNQSSINIKVTNTTPKEVKLDNIVKTKEVEPVIDLSDPDVIYNIDQETIWKLLKISFPWPFDCNLEHNPTSYMDEVKDVFQHLEKDTDDKSIYISKFVNNTSICRLLHNIKKFYAINLVEELQKI